ncbi:MAG: precorrin-6A reductase [Candidatus Methanomethylophilaceae archaeon]|jgi:precorrin-6Y C5,15-methyltransferase (decarboxylating)|nr:precorrin-6A reductase [Candidatus Methanomethylophilaceae archaeon]NLF33935.1 precorrin-6A reductase [Thermoplasmatales archaeon]
MTERVLIFAGTTEGRMLAETLGSTGVEVRVCVATEYGGSMIHENGLVRVSSKRPGVEGTCGLIEETGCRTVVDATHPYATAISRQVREACRRTGAEYVRLSRSEGRGSHDPDVITVPDAAAAAEYLDSTEGNVLLTVGSKELDRFTTVGNYRERLHARVLSLPSVAERCAELGFSGRNLIAMQGPFCEELNYGMLVQTGAAYLVTKDSGHPGGFEEKLRAARRAGAKVIVIGRPEEDGGMSYEEVLEHLEGSLGLSIRPTRRRVSVVGIGMGDAEGMTLAAMRACREADILIGAERMVHAPGLAGLADGKERLAEYRADRIKEFLDTNEGHGKAAVLMSGDVGFYSGARALLEKLDGDRYDVEVLCGTSSLAYLCSKLRIPWQDVHLMSSHGRSANTAGEVRRNRRTFTLLDEGGLASVCAELMEYGLGNVTVAAGTNLGYPDEKISVGTPEEIVYMDPKGLCVALITNPEPDTTFPAGIPDGMFSRGGAPMTKSEVRTLSVAKLRLEPDSVVYDVGAGTGSVSVEMARVAVRGCVYSIEKEPEALELIKGNSRRFCAPNVVTVEGTAPEALEALPAPTHVFVGGSSGNMRGIIGSVMRKNPSVRFVINSVTLETIRETMECIEELGLIEEETVCVSVAKARRAGSYHLMTAQNPVWITVCRGSDE